MPRLQAVIPETTTGRVRELLDQIQTSLGVTPNLARTLANSPAALEGYLNFGDALRRGLLPAKLREQIALAVAQANDCAYCLAAHTAIGRTEGLSEEAILDSRRGESPNSKDATALQFARKLVSERGRVGDEDLMRLRRSGYSDTEIAEIIANVALHQFTTYFNHVAMTEVDFPKVEALAAKGRGLVS